MGKLLSNPFFVYIIGFSVVILVYSLGWSDLYPDLSWPLFTFFIITFIISFAFGLIFHILKRIEYRDISWDDRISFYLFLVWIGYLAEFIYNKGIPLQILLSGQDFDYTAFGIPTFHVFLVTYSSFLSVFIFHQLCSKFSKGRFIYFLLSILPSILIVSRGTLLIVLTSCLFVYLLSLKHVSPKRVIIILFSAIFVFYLFGVMGNLRQNNGKNASSALILEIALATEKFRRSVVPDEFIWSYLYISSPLANLQNTILVAPDDNINWISFLNYELLPDFISKRTGSFFDLPKSDMPRVAPWLTVSTLYARAFVFVGWPGMIVLFLFFITTSSLYLMLLRKRSQFYVVGLAILNTLVLFNTFDNMYMFSGLNLQLVYPLVLCYVNFPKFILRTRQA